MLTRRMECAARTSDPLDFVDLTDAVEEALANSGIEDGQVTVFVAEPSCSLIVNERESGLLADIRAAIERLRSSHSLDGRTLIGSTSVVLPAVEGTLRLGTWQRVLLVDLQGGRECTVVVQIVGE